MCPTKPKYIPPEKVDKSKSWSSTTFDYNAPRWRNLRNAYRNENPICEECKRQGITTPMAIVDHIIPISKDGSAWDWKNLQSLCTPCHNSKSRKEQTKH